MSWGFFQVLIAPIRMVDAGNKDTLEKGGSVFAAAVVVARAAIKAAYWHLPSREMCG